MMNRPSVTELEQFDEVGDANFMISCEKNDDWNSCASVFTVSEYSEFKKERNAPHICTCSVPHFLDGVCIQFLDYKKRVCNDKMIVKSIEAALGESNWWPRPKTNCADFGKRIIQASIFKYIKNSSLTMIRTKMMEVLQANGLPADADEDDFLAFCASSCWTAAHTFFESCGRCDWDDIAWEEGFPGHFIFLCDMYLARVKGECQTVIHGLMSDV